MSEAVLKLPHYHNYYYVHLENYWPQTKPVKLGFYVIYLPVDKENAQYDYFCQQMR